MSVALPRPADFRRAVRVFLAHAYGTEVPPAVKARADKLCSLPDEEFYHSELLEKTPLPVPLRYRLRLGNRLYPHMKISLEMRPDGVGYLYRADTHDQHCCPPPSSSEYAAFMQLMDQNRRLAAQIEAAWEEEGLPTFKTFLREDLQRRQPPPPPPRE